MRKTTNLNENWFFIKEELSIGEVSPKTGEQVNLPHTWNALDGQDGGSDFLRGAFWYTKMLSLAPSPGKKYYLEFEGSHSITDVYVNGTHFPTHRGGFSTFRYDITKALKEGDNLLCVQVDNKENNHTYPQMADFTFFGGIYRNVNLIETSEAHFDLDYYGGIGFTVTPALKEDGSCEISLESFVTGRTDGLKIRYTVTGRDGACILQTEAEGSATVTLDAPHLWDGVNDPYLYTAAAQLLSGSDVLDNVSTRFGIRSFHVDPEKGFFLNGKSYPLHGVSRHQDRENMGWAITRKEHEEDMRLISELGANTIRLAHYQHDQYFYDLCDEYGMMVWAEIPFISVFLETPEARENTVSQMTELVVQNYNHPSVVCWGISNEITIGGDDSPALLDNLRELNELCHKLDSTRPTTIANVSMLDPESPINDITDILSYNHYFGWYVGEVADNADWLDDFHKNFPDKCLGVSEYGAEGILKWHTDTPVVRDYTEEYQAYYHENMLKIFEQRPYLWSTHVWNMFDFGADNRDEGGVKGRNNKGLVTYDRSIRKDSYYVYQAYWTEKPMVHICGRRYTDRVAGTTNIKVYSNCPEVTLTVNGKVFAALKAEKVFQFENVPLQSGENTILADTKSAADTILLNGVDTANESYVLPQEAPSQDGENVANWFNTDTGKVQTLEFPEGYFSIRDKVKDIMSNEEAAGVLMGLMSQASQTGGMKVNKGMMAMMGHMTLENILKMAGNMVPKDAAFYINGLLNKIKK